VPPGLEPNAFDRPHILLASCAHIRDEWVRPIQHMEHNTPSDPTADRPPECEISIASAPRFEIVFDQGRSPHELERAEAAAGCVRDAIEAMRYYPKPTRNQVFEVSMHRAATTELEKLGAYLAALRDCLIDARVANLRGRARLQAIEGGRAPAPEQLTKKPR
jgi:hypothetical protein